MMFSHGIMKTLMIDCHLQASSMHIDSSIYTRWYMASLQMCVIYMVLCDDAYCCDIVLAESRDLVLHGSRDLALMKSRDVVLAETLYIQRPFNLQIFRQVFFPAIIWDLVFVCINTVVNFNLHPCFFHIQIVNFLKDIRLCLSHQDYLILFTTLLFVLICMYFQSKGSTEI